MNMKQSVCVAMLALAVPAMSSAVEIIAHRGASYDAPENTLASFKLGFEQNADANELDFYVTQDGKTIVLHDGTTARTTGVTNKPGQTTFAELRRLDAANWGRWKSKGFAEKLPTLDEALALMPDGKRFFVELKCGLEGLPELQRTLQRAGKKAQQVALIGFDYKSVKEAKQIMPDLQVYFLAGADKKTKQYPPVEELIQKAKTAKLDGLDLEQGFPIDRVFVKKVHDAGLKLYTWTVDDPEVARTQAEAGVDGITTNRPGWLREQLAKR